ncbi:MAG: redoxin domain-containing protein [Bifidobacteriaceae bacterium]|jgi:thiol-disulfide isomerase/thioredoxin|nr:redoxin domain-containing protein [Bifidobacteriaceae bacterium]
MRRLRASELQGRAWIGTGGRELTLADLRGKVVVLDFWTFCCVNCLHVLDELRPLEAKYAGDLVVIGVHSPKFAHEADPAALADAVARYDICHPVLDDPTLITWTAYGARAWPTMVVIDPEGYIVTRMAGEGHGPALDAIVRETIDHARTRGTLRGGEGPYVPPPATPGALAFPSKAIIVDDVGHRLLVADAGHHGLAEVGPDGEVVRRIGSGARGLVDGPAALARFSEPSGVTRLPAALADEVGYDVVVADTVNHALRGVRLADGHVVTVAGTGAPWVPGDPDPWFVPGAPAQAEPRAIPLSSPWDVAWDPRRGAVVIAMAGIHQLWAFDPVTGHVGVVAGTRSEGLADGPADSAWLAQPSGLSVAPGSGDVWFVDSETSALRVLERGIEGEPDTVRTVIGEGLFDFGLVDGPAGDALMQHPLGLAVVGGEGEGGAGGAGDGREDPAGGAGMGREDPAGREDTGREVAGGEGFGVSRKGSRGSRVAAVFIADTYNGALRRYDLASGKVTTVATGLAEPSDVVMLGASRVVVVESAGHRIAEIQVGEAVAVPAARETTSRPVTELQEGRVRLSVPFSAGPGQKLDDRFGPSCQLTVSATPPDLLAVGAGTTSRLERELVLQAGEGVLHVTVRAASCDVDAPNPACHMVAQDWGVPIRVATRTPSGRDPQPQRIDLPLRG